MILMTWFFFVMYKAKCTKFLIVFKLWAKKIPPKAGFKCYVMTDYMSSASLNP
ncbi:hypothetical protein GCM10007962_19550 [Yeosuana aromativorans]|uniref:Uncharacterized protein n=1 Tax=Yeosuana aromativorans TaxID=288019 RepID=A0A8J3BP11_9FLAO|nr:hypothetical protein GCM10007962_19550 [Yeosuana aromativorans]